jgi:hypothetical protein
MIFSIYKRPWQTQSFHIEFLRIREIYKTLGVKAVNKAIDSLCATSDSISVIFLETARAITILYQVCDPEVRYSAIRRLHSIYKASTDVCLSLDRDIILAIDSVLRSEDCPSPVSLSPLDFYDNLSFAEPVSFPLLDKYNGECVVRLPATGFFSYLEHLSLVSFYALSFGVHVTVDISEWNFPIPLNSFVILPSCTMVQGTVHTDFKPFDLTLLRVLAFRAGPAELHLLSLFKQYFYSRMISPLSDILESYCKEKTRLLEEHLDVVFIRGGDKARQETILPSTEIILQSFSHESPHVIISDDTNYAWHLAGLRSSNDIVSGIRDMSGYEFSKDPHNLDSFLDVAYKWLLMVNSRRLTACPSSNLVNTAMFARAWSGATYSPSKGFFMRPSVHF